MSSLASLSTATRLRDVVQAIVRRTLAKERPAEAYGTIVDSDDINRKATVLLAGSTSTVIVSYGHVQPGFVGQIVRIGGVAQDRYIIDVVGPPLFRSPNLDVASLFIAPASDLWVQGLNITGAWPSFTPVLTQSVTVTKTVTAAKVLKLGRLVIACYYLSVTGSGTASQIVTFTLPYTAAAPVGKILGAGYIYDASAGVNYVGLVAAASTTTGALVEANQPNNNYMGASTAPGSFSAGLAINDGVLALIAYESAT